MINQYGADSVRWFILSDSPPEKDVQWSDTGVSSANKFLQKIWNLNHMIASRKDLPSNQEVERKFLEEINNYVFKIDNSIDNFRFNVSIALFYEVYKLVKDHFESQMITCSKGPEFDSLSASQKEVFANQSFTISNDNSRMGYRLNEVFENALPSILTSSALPGTVQLTPSGKLIILMRDCQVTGGYPRVLQLTNTAINQLAQKKTNDTFQFVLRE